ncbi:maleylacetoacetate isomerase [Herbaspirillum rubrisubalbicans]|jgi:maleylpyruvate isomerase|uniref:Maleylacetoacetate isomerase n=2 Tax=Herbaspirillum rubrisubalbicans TaxID=80842 RepID=A0ABX9C3U5_9BURK|nr:MULTISPECIES: maleylacetoacetate isomerase [Herbaspirillum]MCP1576410.1 maleylpyruvate isomerase [Herbaspirillum rubrisubalbicans]NQE50022.1 maleylacetoacetate isomerase [Herbaspirillum rubrisubalbicans]QJP99645.1 maleylacetoacetate isomerase [Herbaspirillum rubrisubalbicans Os34]RAM65214.1 maleylacetoacetate isomerase [Herbaspirillum rubrisubalbicans]RAN48845.1 maleylacetoacetate isomerase [Herbaspirillum rubrisubalbicans]
MTTLYSYFRSSASYRVRIALNLKGVAYETAAVHLLNQGGEQLLPAFTQVNPHALVPVLADQGRLLTQSMAMLEYLEERYPAPALLPGDAFQRAHIRELALAIACEIHPLNNLRVLRYLKHQLAVDEAQKTAWIQHWIKLGFSALEQQLAADTTRGHFCVGDAPTMADCFLVPQIFNARRFEVDMAPYPTLCAIDAACNALPAFQQAHPAQQPDAA